MKRTRVDIPDSVVAKPKSRLSVNAKMFFVMSFIVLAYAGAVIAVFGGLTMAGIKAIEHYNG